jgi:hypothetical protein
MEYIYIQINFKKLALTDILIAGLLKDCSNFQKLQPTQRPMTLEIILSGKYERMWKGTTVT